MISKHEKILEGVTNKKKKNWLQHDASWFYARDEYIQNQKENFKKDYKLYKSSGELKNT